jgi:hypothetical protein
MANAVLTGEQAEEYKRTYADYTAAMVRATEALKAYGMESREFSEADSAAGKLWGRLRQLQGLAGKSWMV